ncbi:hypothetical protein TRIUR3_20503 [Triticum urartu]|uniref:Uncharacterized protein n=1 Tax=Triticum urartu TaxID=4572 RepID=M7ZAN5_TRIUA|nr:hypothetical protein TRIUR3_20503 [Triticum urartu]
MEQALEGVVPLLPFLFLASLPWSLAATRSSYIEAVNMRDVNDDPPPLFPLSSGVMLARE